MSTIPKVISYRVNRAAKWSDAMDEFCFMEERVISVTATTRGGSKVISHQWDATLLTEYKGEPGNVDSVISAIVGDTTYIVDSRDVLGIQVAPAFVSFTFDDYEISFARWPRSADIA